MKFISATNKTAISKSIYFEVLIFRVSKIKLSKLSVESKATAKSFKTDYSFNTIKLFVDC